MVFSNPVKEKMKARKPVIGAMLRFANPMLAEIMIKTGIETVCIDNEHYPFTDEQIVNICRAVHGAGGICTIRLGQKNREAIYRVMDMGVDGILMPNVETAEEADMIVNATKYPSVGGTGNRGCCPITRGADYGVNLDIPEYYRRINDVTTVSIMIESKTGLENLEEILKNKGIDDFTIGPSDMSGSFGRPGKASDPDIKEAIENALNRMYEAGFAVESLAYNLDQVREALSKNRTLLNTGSDLQMLTRSFASHISGAKQRIERLGLKTTGKTVKERINRKEPVLVTYLRVAEPGIAEIAAHSGTDLVIIDDEHFPFTDAELSNEIRGVHLFGGTCVVRVHDKRTSSIYRILDMGADGIVAPQVQSAEEVESIVRAVKYGPRGNRGFCPITTGAGYGFGQTPMDYASKANKETIVGVMVENRLAVEDLDRILKVEGLDFISIGPSDMSASYGYPGQPDHPVVREAIQKAWDKILASGVALQGQAYNDDAAEKMLKDGKSYPDSCRNSTGNRFRCTSWSQHTYGCLSLSSSDICS